MQTLNLSNVTDSDYLELLHQEMLRQNLPVFVYVILLGFVGMIGNSLTLIVYWRKSTKSATNIFIESIAIVDLLTNVICIPIFLCVLNHGFQVPQTISYMCHLFYFFNYSTATISAILLVAVAFVRFRNVCSPLGYHMSAGRARLFSSLIALLSLVLCTPHAVVHGRQTIDTDRPNVKGHLCRTEYSSVGKPWPLIVDGTFIALFVLCSTALTYMYARIGAKAWRHGSLFGAKVHRRLQVGLRQQDNGHKHAASKECLEALQGCETGPGKLSHFDVDIEITELDEANELNLKEVKSRGRLRKKRMGVWRGARVSRQKYNGRTTRMLLVISAIYILTNLTTLVLLFLRNFRQGSKVSVDEDSVMNVFVASYLINSAVNPIIYSVWDRNFRRQCRDLIGRCGKT
ncbi:hypothetical protein Btru_050655 [Bulinus truncatus]|nr:hypothetical protein Btru_050655 [Bulinus truncatus]